MTHARSFPLYLFCVLAYCAGCSADALPEPMELPCDGATPTYAVEVRPIIERSCAYAGCHLGGAPGVYDDYEGLLPALTSGSFRQRVVEVRADPVSGMPPNYAPADRPQDLTARELETITCWLDAGFPRE